MHSNGRTARKLKKLAWRFHQPDWADNRGVWLPVRHPLVSRGIACEIYLGDYEAKEIDIIDNRLAPDDTVFEVGGGLGFLSAYCAQRVGSQNVVAYEANPELIPVIRATHARNAVAPTVINALLALGNGSREFHLEQDFWASSAHRQGGRTITVPQLDLNTELGRIRPSFLIVDIEGGEAELFSIADLSSVRKICIETHADVLGNRALSEMFANILAQGFVFDFSLIRKNVFYFYRDR